MEYKERHQISDINASHINGKRKDGNRMENVQKIRDNSTF
jgi:hypothetical protein